MTPRDIHPHHDEQIDLDSLAGLPALETHLFSPPSLAPSSEEIAAAEARKKGLEPEVVSRRLGFGLRRSMAERLGRAGSTPAGQGTREAQSHDPFATLLTPLSGPELARLRAEVEADTILYDRVTQAGRNELRSQRIGLIGALLLAVLLGRFWFDFLSGLVDVRPPTVLSSHLSPDNARIGVFGLGVLGALLAIGLVSRALSEFAAGVVRRDVGRLATSFCVGTFAAIAFQALRHDQVAAAALVGICGFAVAGVLRLITGSVRRLGRRGR